MPATDYCAGLDNGVSGLRVGLAKEHFGPGLDPEIHTAVMSAAENLRQQGAEVVELDLPVAGHSEYCIGAYYLIAMGEASANLTRYDGVKYGYRADGDADLQEMYRQTRSTGFGAEVKRRIMLGTYALSAGYYDAYYLKAQKVRTLIKNDFERAFETVEVLLAPVAPTVAFPIGENMDDPLQMYLNDVYTVSVNLAGIPGNFDSVHRQQRGFCRSVCSSWQRRSRNSSCCAPGELWNRRPTGAFNERFNRLKEYMRNLNRILILLLASCPAFAINENAGTTGFNFLKIPVGARASALGGAFVAVSGDLESTTWNPAGLLGLNDRAGTVSITRYLVDTEAGFASAAFPGDGHVWALSLNYFNYGDMRRTDAQGQDLGSFGASDLAVYLTRAQPMWRDWLTLGVNLKAVFSRIDDFSSDAYMADVGLLAPAPIPGMTVGAALSNVGTVRSAFAGGSKDSLPVNFSVGNHPQTGARPRSGDHSSRSQCAQ